jgi:hypothetical protein
MYRGTTGGSIIGNRQVIPDEILLKLYNPLIDAIRTAIYNGGNSGFAEKHNAE